jgi:hypothetical protein
LRYQSIPVTREEPAQVERLKYLLAHGCKEGLVERLEDWPGAHCVHSLLKGEPLEGIWYERDQETRARNRGQEIAPGQFEMPETVTFDPLPCWQHLSLEEQRQRVAHLVEEIEAEAAAERKRTWQHRHLFSGGLERRRRVERVCPLGWHLFAPIRLSTYSGDLRALIPFRRQDAIGS